MATRPKDRRVRTRLANDCRRNAGLFASELEHYRDAFWTTKVSRIKAIIAQLRALADRIDDNDRLEQA